MKGYFDGSGTKDSDFLVLSGAVATDAAWNGFDAGWDSVLAAHPLKPKHLHMKELSALQEDFSRDKGWTTELGNQLVTSLLMYAQTLDKKRFRTFTCSVDMEAYREIEANGGLLPNVYELCVYTSPQQVLKWYADSIDDIFPEKIHYFFDQGEKFKGRFESRWNRGRKTKHKIQTPWHLISTVATAVSEDTPGIQLADLCAWARNRSLVVKKHGQNAKYTHLSVFSEGVLPLTHRHYDREQLEVTAFGYENYPKVFSDRSFPVK